MSPDIPALAGGFPLLGHALSFGRDPIRLLTEGHRRHGDLFSLRLLGRTIHAIRGPRANEAFFRAPDDQLSAREAYRFTVPIFGPGVAYDAEPELMDQQLRMLHRALRDERMQAYVEIMCEEADALIGSWGEEGELDLLDMLNTMTIFIAGRCLIGDAFRQRMSREFTALYHDLEGGLNLVAFFNPYVPLPAMRRRDRARRRVVELISGLIAERRATGARENDFLSALIEARDERGDELSDDVVAGLLLTVLFAGQHTSAVLAAWTGLLLIEHPEHLHLVRHEAEDGFGDRIPTLGELKGLHHLERCIKEAERLRPPLIMLMRTVLREFECLGRSLPAGDLVLVSPAVSHRMSEIFAEPDRFDPDRFAPGREEDRRTPYSLIGFGGGKHRCVGLAFAYQQIKVIWARILSRYELTASGSEHQPNYATWVVGPRQPCRIRYRRRTRPVPVRGAPGTGHRSAAR